MRIRDLDKGQPLNAAAVYPAIIEAGDWAVCHPHYQAEWVFEIKGELLSPVPNELVTSRLRQTAQYIQRCRRIDLGETRLDLLSTTGTVLVPEPVRIIKECRITLLPEAELHLSAPTENYTPDWCIVANVQPIRFRKI